MTRNTEKRADIIRLIIKCVKQIVIHLGRGIHVIQTTVNFLILFIIDIFSDVNK